MNRTPVRADWSFDTDTELVPLSLTPLPDAGSRAAGTCAFWALAPLMSLFMKAPATGPKSEHSSRSSGVLARALCLLTVAVSLPVSADCGTGAKTVFSCLTAAGKQVQVCDAGRTIDYSYGRPGQKPEIVVQAPRASASTYQWAGVGRSMTYRVDIPNGDTRYSVFWSADRLSEQHAIEAGVTVERNGEELATVRCLVDKKLVQRIEGIDLKPSD
jgi:hypothetical protein